MYEKIKEILKLREKTIIELRFGWSGEKPKTQNQIAEMLGISRSYVSRIETKAIGKLANEIKE
jgi:RNA polymerase sporulation-specific sigma factor